MQNTTSQPIILKFGGTSLSDGKRIKNAVQRIADQAKRHPVVVTSAMSKVTSKLIETAEAALAKNQKKVTENLAWLRKTHVTVAQSAQIQENISALLGKLEEHCAGIAMVDELTPRSLDAICSFGERLSSWLMVDALRQRGLNAERFNSRDMVQTDEQFGKAEIDWDNTCPQIRQTLVKTIQSGVIPVVTGYIGATDQGQTTTLGRGGSDYSAALLGVCLAAAEIQIWTDVDGMMTADPRVVTEAHALPHISFQEAAELAYFGAKVLHPKTIQPAIDAKIPVKILNTHNPEAPGTTIIRSSAQTENSIKAIAFKKGISVINICSSRMLGPYGFMAKIFQVFADHKIPVDTLATSEVSVSVTIEDDAFTDELIRDLEQFSSTNVVPHQAIICVVGNGLKNDYRVEQNVFNTLAENQITTELISKGASQINLTFIVHSDSAEKTVQCLHDTFFTNNP